MRITVLGCGRWGSFLAWYAQRIGHDTCLWGRPGSLHLARLQQEGRNEYLALDAGLTLTDDLSLALDHGELILVSVSAQGLRSLLGSISLPQGKPFILCMKGLEIGSGLRLSQVFHQALPQCPVGVWVGPGHVQSFVLNIPNCMVIDSEDTRLQKLVIEALGSDLIRFYYGNDLIGNEIGAAAKNIAGIAAGMLDGFGMTALKGALMARAPREIFRLIEAQGGNGHSAYGLAHLGDYEATLFSAHSHNRQFGEDFVKGVVFDKLAEGMPTLEAVYALGQELGLDLPICNALYAILFQRADAYKQLSALFGRSLKGEFA